MSTEPTRSQSARAGVASIAARPAASNAIRYGVIWCSPSRNTASGKSLGGSSVPVKGGNCQGILQDSTLGKPRAAISLARHGNCFITYVFLTICHPPCLQLRDRHRRRVVRLGREARWNISTCVHKPGEGPEQKSSGLFVPNAARAFKNFSHCCCDVG